MKFFPLSLGLESKGQMRLKLVEGNTVTGFCKCMNSKWLKANVVVQQLVLPYSSVFSSLMGLLEHSVLEHIVQNSCFGPDIILRSFTEFSLCLDSWSV